MKIRNDVTGKEFVFSDDPASRSGYTFKLICKALDRVSSAFHLQIYFLTLTLRDDSVDAVNRDLNKFITFLRTRFKRSDSKWYYVWVVELQKKRYRKSGVKALHWHFAIVCPDGALPDVGFRQNMRPHYLVKEQGKVITSSDLFDRWGLGQVFCMRAYSRGVYGYLSKYFTKEYDKLPDYNSAWLSLRRFGSSQFGFYRFPQWALDGVQGRARSDSAYLDLAIKREGARVNFYGRELEPSLVIGGTEIRRWIRVDSIRSPWKVVRDGSQKKGVSDEVATD